MDNLNTNNRNSRIASLAKREMAQMLQERKIKPLSELPAEVMVSILGVTVEKGYHHIRFFVSVYGIDDGDKKRVLSILEQSASNVRGEICRRLKLRAAPGVSFHLDDTLEKGVRIDEILSQIQRDSEDKASE